MYSCVRTSGRGRFYPTPVVTDDEGTGEETKSYPNPKSRNRSCTWFSDFSAEQKRKKQKRTHILT